MSQAGLFSAVTSAFIIEVDSRLQRDPGDETAALLRLLIYKIDNTTFGDDVPTLPQWNGPPRAMVHVQAILFASLATSLLAAFLAMLGKQWLNRYGSSDVRGSAIERSHNRQRKLDGVVAWYFDYVMESLPLILQAALLLLGCALSRYLWDVSTIVASVVLGATSFGILFYIFIIIAGAASESCPYQTPGSLALRYLGHKVPAIIQSRHSIAAAFKKTFKKSKAISVITRGAGRCHPWRLGANTLCFLGILVVVVPFAFGFDLFILGRAAARKFATLSTGVYHLIRGARHHLCGVLVTPEQRSDQQATVSDLRCISWTLQASLDTSIRLSIVEHLSTKTELTYFDPTLVVDPCFDVLTSCININGLKMVTIPEKEQLATASARCFLRSLNRLSAIDPASRDLADIFRRYNKIFPFETDFAGLPFYYTMTKIHALTNQLWKPRSVRWDDYRPSDQEHTTFARHMVEVAQVEYQQSRYRKVPRWILRFVLRSLSLDSPPPASVLADCLTIVAIDLGCDVRKITASEERYVQIVSVPTPLTKA